MTGFLLVATIPTKTLIFAIGIALVLVGVAVWWALGRRGVSAVVALAVVAGVTGVAAASTDQPCERESAYFCIRVERDPVNPDGRTLWLDNGRHSYVNLADPTVSRASPTCGPSPTSSTSAFPAGPIDAVHVGGGGFTFPRYLDAARPGSRNTVLEIDPEVLATAREELGLRTSRDLQVQIGDGRLLIRGVRTDSADLVVGDAFNSLSVPWHLTTREFVAEIDRVLRADGVYVMNIIDEPPFRFVRARARHPARALRARRVARRRERDRGCRRRQPRAGRLAPRARSPTRCAPGCRRTRRTAAARVGPRPGSSATPRCSPTTSRPSTSGSPTTTTDRAPRSVLASIARAMDATN